MDTLLEAKSIVELNLNRSCLLIAIWGNTFYIFCLTFNREYYHYTKKYFSGNGFPFFIVLEELDYEAYDVQDKILNFKTSLEASTDLVSGKINFWYNDMISWIVFLGKHREEYNANNRRIPPHKFYAWLNEFLQTEGAPHSINLVFNKQGKLKVVWLQ